MFGAVIKWLTKLSVIGKVGVATASIVAVGVIANTSTPPTSQSVSTPSASTPAQPVVTHKTISETKSIPFTSSSINDSTISLGKTVVKTYGVNGSETITYDVTYSDGIETNRTIVARTTNASPINEVIAIGTYTTPYCPNGTYVNTYGNEVCRPYSSPSKPAGATAQCVDGTYSFSQSRSGTCSHHGGVASWL